MPSIPPDDSPLNHLAAFVQREIYQLAVLIAVAVLAFLAIRQLEVRLAAVRAGDEQWWFARGETLMRSGDPAGAVDAYQRAVATNRTELRYALALGRAFTAAGDDGSARALLTSWRATVPESAELNLQLARLAAARHDVAEAVRFYNFVLYAPPAASEDPARPDLRFELARFLVAHDQSSQAIAELVVATERPLSRDARLEASALFNRAGDQRAALDQYRLVLRDDGANRTALIGVANTQFNLGDYTSARDAFRAAAPLTGPSLEIAEVTDLVLENDPLMPRLPAVQRARRLRDTIAYLYDRFAACEASTIDPDGHAAIASALGNASRSLRLRPDAADTIAHAADAVDGAVRWAASKCPATTTRSRALGLIAARHEAVG